MQILLQVRPPEIVLAAVTDDLAHKRVAIGQALGFGDEVNHIHPEAVNTLFKPPADHFRHLGAHFGIVPIQIHLLGGEQVQCPLVELGVIIPSRAGKQRGPIVGRYALALALAENVIIFILFIAGKRFLEPLVLIGGVVDYKVHHQL